MDKKLKLITANNELENLNLVIVRDDSCNKELALFNKHMVNILEYNINNFVKLSGIDDIIILIVNICRERQQISELLEDTLIDDFHFLRGNDILHDAAMMFFTVIDGATNI